jgi:hypothetical protein
MARDVHPEIRRALGAADLHSSKAAGHAQKAERLLNEAAGKPREKQPSLADIDAKLERLDHKFDDPEETTLSMHLPGGAKISARGVKAVVAAVLIALLLAVVAGLFFLGRATAPHRHGETTEQK